MDFERIDINQCPKGKGNSGPNRFANTTRCKTETTEVLGINGIVICLLFYGIVLADTLICTVRAVRAVTRLGFSKRRVSMQV